MYSQRRKFARYRQDRLHHIKTSYLKSPLRVSNSGRICTPHGYSAAELHTHTVLSDGTQTVEQNLLTAKIRGISVLATTDHDMIQASLTTSEICANYGVSAVVGSEITTIGQQHILGLFINTCIPIFRRVETTVQAIRSQGGLAIVAHPFLPFPGATNKRRLLNWLERTTFDGIELDSPYLTSRGREQLLEFYEDHKLALGAPLASSDAHFGNLGTKVTLFPGSDANDLRTAIKMRTTVAAATTVPDIKPNIRNRVQNNYRSLFSLPIYRLKALVTGNYK